MVSNSGSGRQFAMYVSFLPLFLPLLTNLLQFLTYPCSWRATEGTEVTARMGMDGRYLAIRRALLPDSVRTTI